MDNTEYKRIVEIDYSDILKEYQEQSIKYFEQAVLLVHARTRREQAKLAMDVIEAKLNTSVRQEASKSGTKTTEASIHSAVVSLGEYQTAVRDWIQAKQDEGMQEAIVKALEQRKDMLICLSKGN